MIGDLAPGNFMVELTKGLLAAHVMRDTGCPEALALSSVQVIWSRRIMEPITSEGVLSFIREAGDEARRDMAARGPNV